MGDTKETWALGRLFVLETEYRKETVGSHGLRRAWELSKEPMRSGRRGNRLGSGEWEG